MKTKLCECGCGMKTKIIMYTNNKKGRIKGESDRFIYNHHLIKKNRYIVNKDGCWVWQLATDKDGYGQTRQNGKHIRAHRLYYEKYKSKIPNDKVIDHLCKNPACVNPEHLDIVTQQENVHRGNNTKLTWEKVKTIRRMYATGIQTSKQLSKMFSISKRHVFLIINNERWVPEV